MAQHSAVQHLRDYPASTLDGRTLEILREQIVKARIDYWAYLTLFGDGPERGREAERTKDEINALDWALTSANAALANLYRRKSQC